MHKNAAFYYLHRAVRNLLHLKCVDNPHSEIADEEESDHLPAGLVGVLAAGGDAAALGVSDEQELKQDLEEKRTLKYILSYVTLFPIKG